MALLEHIFNIQKIVKKVEKNLDEENLYQKVNNAFKGSVQASPALIEEVKEILASEYKKAIADLNSLLEKKKENKKK